MNNTQTTDGKWLMPIAIIYTIIMLAWMFYCGIASHRIDARQNVITTTTTSATTTLQWSADTAWTKGGWR